MASGERMQIALVQCAARCGDFAGNLAHLEECLAAASNDVLYLLPPNALAGFATASLAKSQSFATAQEQALAYLARHLPHKRLLVPLTPCGQRQNLGCAFLREGSWQELALGSSSQQGHLMFGRLELEGLTLGLLVGGSALPLEDPLADLDGQVFAGKSCDLLCVSQAFAWSPGLVERLFARYAALAKDLACPIFAVSAVGGEDGSLFSGQSLVLDQKGKLCCRGLAFEEDLLVSDAQKVLRLSPDPEPLEAIWLALLRGTKDFVRHCGLSKVFVGLSGGLDSALVLCVAAHALGPEQVYAVLMPSPYTSEASKEDALALARNLGVEHLTLPISPLMQTLQKYLEPALTNFPPQKGDVTWENLQARIRGLLLSTLANRAQALILNTSNKSEAATGYSTLYGDTVGALAVIGDLTKSQVYAVARWYRQHFPREQEIPLRILEKAPSAELAPNQKDSDSLPPYEVLDPILCALLCGTAPRTATERSLGKRLLSAEFKRRQEPLALMLSSVPFGSAFRLPVAARFCPPVLA